jgi:sigma-E factor negative regulatory protein RseA
MTTQFDITHEQISALSDGCLNGQEFASLVAVMEQSSDALQTWHAYHLIGDVLRSEALAPNPVDLAFLERFEVQLALEPVRLLPAAQTLGESMAPAAAVLSSANADVLRWKWLAGAALTVLVSVAVVEVWNPLADSSTQLSSSTQADSQVMVRDPQLDAMMAAHRQMGGHSALQMPSGFLRNATFERPAR